MVAFFFCSTKGDQTFLAQMLSFVSRDVVICFSTLAYKCRAFFATFVNIKRHFLPKARREGDDISCLIQWPHLHISSREELLLMGEKRLRKDQRKRRLRQTHSGYISIEEVDLACMTPREKPSQTGITG